MQPLLITYLYPLNLVPNVSSYIVIEDMSDHLPIILKIHDVQLAEKKQTVIESRDLRPKNVERLKQSIGDYDWQGFLSSVILGNDKTKNVIPQNVTVNEMFNRFHNKILDLLDKHVPSRKRTVNSKKFRKEPWLTNGLCISILKCKQLYKQCIHKDSTDSVNEQYKHYRNCLNKLKRQAKQSYYQKLCTNLKNNNKKLWEIINTTISKSSNKMCILKKLKVGNIMYDSATNIANSLGSYFATVSTKFANAIKLPNIKVSAYTRKIKRNQNSLFLEPTTITEISNLIGVLPNKSSLGFDQINNKLLKIICVEISKPLEIIFNESLNSGIFPEKMKMVEVIPLYKSKSKFEPGNYRPISLLLTMSKILEKLLYK